MYVEKVAFTLFLTKTLALVKLKKECNFIVLGKGSLPLSITNHFLCEELVKG